MLAALQAAHPGMWHLHTPALTTPPHPCMPAATYTAGSTISVSFNARVNHGGWISIKVCPSARTGMSQACFDQNTLTK
jgi:hypothetical protein